MALGSQSEKDVEAAPGRRARVLLGVIIIRAQQHRMDLVLGGVQSTPESRLLQMDTACWHDKCYHSPITHGDENTPALSFFFPEDDSAGSVFPALAALPTRE